MQFVKTLLKSHKRALFESECFSFFPYFGSIPEPVQVTPHFSAFILETTWKDLLQACWVYYIDGVSASG